MTITLKANGKYQVRVQVAYDPLTGKRNFKYATATSKKEAVLIQAKITADAAAGVYQQEWEEANQQRHLNFEEAYQEWFAIYEKTGKSLNTIYHTRYDFEHYLIPMFGSMMLERMTRAKLQPIINEFMPTLVSSRSIIARASRLLKWAVKMDDIFLDENPFDKVELVAPKPKKEKAVSYYDEQQAQQFERGLNEYWGNIYPQNVALFTTLLRTGARVGEVTALTWGVVDWAAKQLTLKQHIVRIHGNEREIVKGLKNGDAQRVVDIDDIVIRSLRIWRNELTRRGRIVHPNDFIFKTRVGLPMMYQNVTSSMRSLIKGLNRELGYNLPMLNVHGLRHTHASLLISNGVELKQVSDRLGHKNIAITANIYADVTPKSKRTVVDQFSKILASN